MTNNKQYEELVKTQSESLVAQIVKEVVKKKAVEVHFEEDDDDQWAIVRTHDEDKDLEMSIRFQSGEKWVLQFGYYNDDDDFIELLQPLTPAGIDGIPQGLQKVMRKVLASEEGLRVPGNLLAK